MPDVRDFDQIVKDHLLACPGTSVSPADYGFTERLRFLMTSLGGEVGEAQNLIKKEWRGDFREDGLVSPDWKAKLVGEIVDVANYVCMLAAHLDIDLKDQQLAKLLDVEKRPGWPFAMKAYRQPAAAKIEQPPVGQRDEIYVDFEGRSLELSVPLRPIGSVVHRMWQALARDEYKTLRVTGFRTSVATREALDDAGVISGGGLKTGPEGRRWSRLFLGYRIRVWGEMT